MFRVIVLRKIVDFKNYSEALIFKQKFGGVIYLKIGSYGRR